MREHASDLGRRLLAIVILLAVAWLVFKVVLSVVMTVVWIAIALIAVVGVLWALKILF
jgi:hypothetical protein